MGIIHDSDTSHQRRLAPQQRPKVDGGFIDEDGSVNCWFNNDCEVVLDVSDDGVAEHVPVEPQGQSSANPSPGISGSVTIRTSNPRRLRQLRIPAPTPESPRRGYDGTGNFLQRIDRVTTALVYGTMVSIDHVSDYWNLMIQATTVTGSCFYLLVSKRGWVPARPLDREERGDDGYGRTVKFSFTTDVPRLRSQRLSYADRQRLLGGIAGRFLGEPNWDRVKAAR